MSSEPIDPGAPRTPDEHAAVVACGIAACLRSMIEECESVYPDAAPKSLASSVLFLLIHVLTSLREMIAFLEKHPSKVAMAWNDPGLTRPGSFSLCAQLMSMPREPATAKPAADDDDVRELVKNFMIESRLLARKLDTPLANEVERAVYELAVKHGAAPPDDDWRARVAAVEAGPRGDREVMS
jgi:hypothetical protein